MASDPPHHHHKGTAGATHSKRRQCKEGRVSFGDSGGQPEVLKCRCLQGQVLKACWQARGRQHLVPPTHSSHCKDCYLYGGAHGHSQGQIHLVFLGETTGQSTPGSGVRSTNVFSLASPNRNGRTSSSKKQQPTSAALSTTSHTHHCHHHSRDVLTSIASNRQDNDAQECLAQPRVCTELLNAAAQETGSTHTRQAAASGGAARAQACVSPCDVAYMQLT